MKDQVSSAVISSVLDTNNYGGNCQPRDQKLWRLLLYLYERLVPPIFTKEKLFCRTFRRYVGIRKTLTLCGAVRRISTRYECCVNLRTTLGGSRRNSSYLTQSSVLYLYERLASPNNNHRQHTGLQKSGWIVE